MWKILEDFEVQENLVFQSSNFLKRFLIFKRSFSCTVFPIENHLNSVIHGIFLSYLFGRDRKSCGKHSSPWQRPFPYLEVPSIEENIKIYEAKYL